MTDVTASVESIELEGALTLSVGWKVGKKTHLRQLAVGTEVGQALRDVLASTLADIDEREAQDWAPDADLTPETYLTLDVAAVGSAPELASEHGAKNLIESLAAAEDLPILHAKDLPAGDLSFYAVTIGDTPGQRAVFIRRSNPRRGLKRGRIYSILRDTLQRVEKPIFAFDDWMDLVVVDTRVVVLSQTVFAALFRDQDALQKQVPEWTGDLSQAVAISGDGQERLTARAQRDSRIRARLESIVRRGHLASVSREKLIAELSKAGLDAAVLIDADGHFILQDEHIPSVLYFLNEDLFSGALTEVGFRADKKATR